MEKTNKQTNKQKIKHKTKTKQKQQQQTEPKEQTKTKTNKKQFFVTLCPHVLTLVRSSCRVLSSTLKGMYPHES